MNVLTGRPNKHALNIIDRPIPKTRPEIPTVSFSAYAYLFSELISYAMDRAASITELEERCVSAVVAVGRCVGRFGFGAGWAVLVGGAAATSFAAAEAPLLNFRLIPTPPTPTQVGQGWVRGGHQDDGAAVLQGEAGALEEGLGVVVQMTSKQLALDTLLALYWHSTRTAALVHPLAPLHPHHLPSPPTTSSPPKPKPKPNPNPNPKPNPQPPTPPPPD